MLITLLTDFGTSDYFVGAMKGAILSVHAEARIFDLTHEIPPHNIRTGAFLLLASYRTFPPETIHIAVVDPGVGSARRPLLVGAGGQFFIGPDNGIFSYIYERETDARVFHLTREEYFRHPVSATFHGRDIFAPIGGALSMGLPFFELGVEITDYVRLEASLPALKDNDRLEGSILHIDRFGNCITNLTREHVTADDFKRGACLIINGEVIKVFRDFFAEGEDGSGELFAICGSAGFLEIVAFQDSAARRLNVQRGQSFELRRNI
jgi:S-adenosylmethionine hydrolase